MNVKSVIVLGAGTAGLISALILKRSWNNLDISIIKSDTIDIVGVGEGSTEHWFQFMEYLGILPESLFKEAGATFKHGILFDNWNGDGESYIHNVNDAFIQRTHIDYPHIYHKLIAESENPDNIVDEYIRESRHFQPVEYSTRQYHFDTFKLNTFLLKICNEFGINIITDTITNVCVTDNGIDKLISNTSEYTSDFYVDASGFAKTMIKKLDYNWIDCSNNLPVNSAFTFPTSHSGDYSAFTSAIAMNCGWMWKIPTQERYGNGYVYCDKFISEEDAIQEVEEFYNTKINVIKRFKFNAGYLEKPWIKNCLAIGLSGSFVEPLEATNIGTAIQQSFGLASHLSDWSLTDTAAEDNYNLIFNKVFQNIVDFVQLHYLTKRVDTEFWRYCNSDLQLTEFNQKTLKLFKNQIPSIKYFTNPFILFNQNNWPIIMHGLDLFDRDSIVKSWEELPENIRLESLVKLQVYYSRDYKNTLSNTEAIDYILKEL